MVGSKGAQRPQANGAAPSEDDSGEDEDEFETDSEEEEAPAPAPVKQVRGGV